MKLKRIRAGEYRTADGRFTLLLHPESRHGLLALWRHDEWLIYDKHDPTHDSDGNLPIHDDTFTSLGEARRWLERQSGAGRT